MNVIDRVKAQFESLGVKKIEVAEWGGREADAEGSMGRQGVWGGREYGAEGSMPVGRKGG